MNLRNSTLKNKIAHNPTGIIQNDFLLSYKPAQLREYPKRWTIEFYQINPETKKLVRISKTYNLNRIADLTLRMKRANEIIAHLNNDLLPHGYPFVDLVSEKAIRSNTDLLDAIRFAYKVKSRGKRISSHRTFKHQMKTFVNWYESLGIEKTVIKFTKHYAQGYIDYLKFEKKIGERAFNNHLGFIRSMFNILLERDYVDYNVFEKFKREKETQKKRRPFYEDEKEIVLKRIYETDIWLFRSILLMYFCYTRKTELLKLRFMMFDFKKGVLRMPASITKNKRDNIKTIPDAILKYFLMPDFINQKPTHFVFGKGFKPNGNIPCSKNLPTKRHRDIIDQLKKEGKLVDTEGLQYYSWKDTGITDHMKTVDAQHVSDQASHSDISTTMIYRHKDEVNQRFKELELGFDLPE